ncbi:MAG: pyridoxal 5'-phosphate synthase glutaminase subunit PdxT [Armatimonadota bacterium]|nr:pyridoxal 5'-phosphate synthase glutaminase subunit PdxT [bacterium]
MNAVATAKLQNQGQGKLSTEHVCIGVLGLQGDYQKHLEMLHSIDGVNAKIVRTAQEISEWCDGLVIPGGESTTVGKLMARYGVDTAIIERAAKGMAVFGTCTGMILLASEIEGSDQHRLGLMDTTVRRNAYGRQLDSFEADLDVPCLGGKTVRAVFIRAPQITAVGSKVEVLATLESGEAVMIRQGNCLAISFHPELTDDTRVHKYFVEVTREAAVGLMAR